MKKLASLGVLVSSILMSTMTSFAGDRLLSNAFELSTNKPNTGDTNMVLIYGAIIAVAIVLLIVINFKGSKKNKNENFNELVENRDDINREKNNDDM